MNAGGWTIMIASWTFVIGVCSYLVFKALKK